MDVNAQSNGYALGGTIPCGQPFILGDGLRNNLDSIMNRTSGTMYLYDAVGRAFKTGETDSDGRWGNLPVSFQDKVVSMRLICT